MARVLLVNPPFYRLLGSHYNANSLGIAYIASLLNERGHDAWLYNADFQNENSYKKLEGYSPNFKITRIILKILITLFGMRLQRKLRHLMQNGLVILLIQQT